MGGDGGGIWRGDFNMQSVLCPPDLSFFCCFLFKWNTRDMCDN